MRMRKVLKGRSDLSKSALIKLVEGSTQEDVSLDTVKSIFQAYLEKMDRTGKQLGWDYRGAAFPYSIEEKEENGSRYLVLRGKEPSQYYYLLVGVGKEKETGNTYIQVVVPDRATAGDRNKANEYSRFIAKSLQAELHMTNGRVLYYYPRK
jgi:hypothetical protein